MAAESGTASEANAADKRHFALRVFPLLQARCFPCHGDKADDIEGDLDLRSRAALLRGGESGKPALVAGNPSESLLLAAIRWDGLEMPPKENDRFDEKQIAAVEKWIERGAVWPNADERAAIHKIERATPENEDGVLVATSGGLADEWTFRRYKKSEVWAFTAYEKPAVPKTSSQSDGPVNPIDAFLESRLKKDELGLAPQADPQTLLRRACFDLTGLPPTPRESRVFAKSWSKDPDKAWSELLDRLLASPHYGERWAQHWLDVVRYADTSGFSNDYERSNAWRYRDYVVRSFNADKAYDEFVVEQVAGDELRPDDPEARVATGFLRMGPWGTAMIPQEEARQLYRDDLVHSIGQTFLSVPMRCAKCHDHKFDPIPTRDYYRMYAAVSATQPVEVPAPFLDSENRKGFEQKRSLVKKLYDFAEADRKRLVNLRESAAKKWYAEHGLPYKDRNARNNDPDDKKPPRHVGLDYVAEGTLKVREQDSWIWNRRFERYQPMAQSVFNGPDQWQNGRKLRAPKKFDKAWRPKSYIFLGGALAARGESVGPGVLSALAVPVRAENEDPHTISDAAQGRRLALARWIADGRNPMTARSIVNRVWQHHFGRGLVATANNFGVKGSKPSHPELLNWLGQDFVAGDWRFKRLHKLIMTSKAYRQASLHPQQERLDTIDPDNRLLARFNPRMLSAEEIRDGMLHISGELNPEVGGVPVMPEINREVALEPRMIQFSIAPAYQPSPTPAERNRRSIYAYRVRGQANPFLEILNAPNPNESCESREATAVTPQAFTLLNSEATTDRSIAFALRLQKERKSLKKQIAWAFRLAYGRAPEAEESRRFQAYVQAMKAEHETRDPKPLINATQITRSLVEEFSGKPFEYTEILPVYENYVSDPKPWTVDASTRALADLCLLLFNSNEFLYVY